MLLCATKFKAPEKKTHLIDREPMEMLHFHKMIIIKLRVNCVHINHLNTRGGWESDRNAPESE